MADYVVPLNLLGTARPLPRHVSLECLPSLLHPPPCPKPSLPTPTPPPIPADMRIAYPALSTNSVLQLFLRPKNTPKRIPPKLENLRSSVMRSFKKTIRVILGGEAKRYLIKKLPQNSVAFQEAHRKLQECVCVHLDLCKQFSVARNGPQVDSHRRKSGFKTYNNAYLKAVFSSREMRELFANFVSVVFADVSPESLCARFQLMCCESKAHCTKCGEKWYLLRKVLDQYLGVELDDPLPLTPVLTLF